MSIWKRLFGGIQESSAPAGGKPAQPAATSRGLTERDNVGTRYETQERVNNFWAPYFLRRPAFPFIFFDMPEKKAAVDAMLSLPPIKIASDSGNLISTEVLQFGVYPLLDGARGSWGFFLAGDQVTRELYDTAIASCEKHGGKDPRVSDPPGATAVPAASKTPSSSSSVTFDWEEKVDMLAQMKARGITIVGGDSSPKLATKRHYKAPSKAAALAFLKENGVDRQFYYLIVHTPRGVFGRDKDGIFEQPE